MGTMSLCTTPRLGAPGWVSLLLAASLASELTAQDPAQLQGLVTEAGTDRPIIGAVIEIDSLGLRAISNARGEFALPAVPAGEHRVEVRQFGYITIALRVRLPRNAPIRVGLAPEPIALEGIEVMVRRLEEAERTQASRRNSHPRSVEYIGPGRIEETVGLPEHLLQSGGVDIGRCRAGAGGCPRICINERPARGGLAELNSYPIEALHSIEIYSGVPTVRVYTRSFMEAVANGQEQLRSLRFC